jgi:antitoxin (DNA-binding transcriptional repressor) of toxin-antitoxin stability system
MTFITRVTTSAHRLDEARIYTVTELNQNTARVLDEINRSGRPAAVTRHGKFVAMITPLTNHKIESVVLSEGPLAEEFVRYARHVDADSESDLLTDEDVEARTRGS